MGGYYWYSDNPNCGRCGHLNGHGFCNMTACIYPVLPQTAVMTEHRLTHGDSIRSMTNEELAEFAVGSGQGCAPGKDFVECCFDHKDGPVEADCRKCWLDWLKEEAASNG